MKRGTVVVTDGAERACLASVRSLGEAGWEVHVVADRRRSLAGASRWASGTHVAPSALDDPAAYRAALAAIVSAVGADVLLPIAEASLFGLGEDRSIFAPAAIPFPGLSELRAAADKSHVSALARDLGIAVPETVIVPDRNATIPNAEALGYPVVAKPARSVRPDTAPGSKFGVSYASSAVELAELLGRLPDGAFPLLLQRCIRGTGAGVFLFLHYGAVVASFGHRRVRERPPSGGVSVFRTSAAVPPRLLAQAGALLARLDWTGVAMVEFKVEVDSGTPYLMEINPRLWGSLQLAIDAGVPFPLLLAETALGHPPAPRSGYAVGVNSRWLWGEADHLIARTRAALRARGVWAAVREAGGCLQEQLADRGPATRLEVLRAGDLRPFLYESTSWVRDVLR